MYINYYIKILKALGDPARLKLIKVLSSKELCVCEIESVMDMKQTTVSQQLRRLKEADLVIERKDGWWSYYSLNYEKLNEFINSFKDFIGMEITQIKDFEVESKRLANISENLKVLKCKKGENF